MTPYFANFGREHVISGDSYKKPKFDDDETVLNRPQIRNLDPVFEDVRERLKTAHVKAKHRYDLRKRPQQFEEGTSVWRKNYVLSDASKNFTAKFARTS